MLKLNEGGNVKMQEKTRLFYRGRWRVYMEMLYKYDQKMEFVRAVRDSLTAQEAAQRLRDLAITRYRIVRQYMERAGITLAELKDYYDAYYYELETGKRGK